MGEKEQLGFDRNLWNKFATIQQYNRAGAQQLAIIKTFAEAVNQSTLAFATSLRKNVASLDKELHQAHLEDEQYSTLALAFKCVKNGIENLAVQMEEVTSNVIGDLVEPLDTFTRLYVEETRSKLHICERTWAHFEET